MLSSWTTLAVHTYIKRFMQQQTIQLQWQWITVSLLSLLIVVKGNCLLWMIVCTSWSWYVLWLVGIAYTVLCIMAIACESCRWVTVRFHPLSSRLYREINYTWCITTGELQELHCRFIIPLMQASKHNHIQARPHQTTVIAESVALYLSSKTHPNSRWNVVFTECREWMAWKKSEHAMTSFWSWSGRDAICVWGSHRLYKPHEILDHWR